MTTCGIYRINEKKCATCSYWAGSREIQFNANKPFYVKAIAGSFQCLVNKSKMATGGTTCLKWKLWEKI